MHLLLQLEMEIEDIESWYEEEKQKYMDDYLKDLEDGVESAICEKKFHQKMSKVMEKYNKMMEKKIDEKAKNKKSFIQSIRQKFSFN